MYLWLKYAHLSFVVLTLGLFVLRGSWMLVDSVSLSRPWVRILPHVNDSLLLASGIALYVYPAPYPLAYGWLLAKLALLVCYIGLGMLALRPGRPKPVRATAWAAALGVFGLMLWVAIAKPSFGT